MDQIHLKKGKIYNGATLLPGVQVSQPRVVLHDVMHFYSGIVPEDDSLDNVNYHKIQKSGAVSLRRSERIKARSAAHPYCRPDRQTEPTSKPKKTTGRQTKAVHPVSSRRNPLPRSETPPLQKRTLEEEFLHQDSKRRKTEAARTNLGAINSSNIKNRLRGKPETVPLRRSVRRRFPRLKFWENERVQYRFLISGDIEVLGVVGGREDAAVAEEETRDPGQRIQQWLADVEVGKAPESVEEGAAALMEEGRTAALVEEERASAAESEEERAAAPMEEGAAASTEEESAAASVEKEISSGPQRPPIGYRTCTTFKTKYVTYEMLNILPNCMKPPKFVPYQDMHFVVVTGKVELEFNESHYVLKKGDSFVIPRWNVYGITNLRSSSAILSCSIHEHPLL